MGDCDEIDGLDETLPRYAARSFGRAVVDGLAPLVSLWLFWQLQDEGSRLRRLLADAGSRAGDLRAAAGEWRGRLWALRLRRDLERIPTTED